MPPEMRNVTYGFIFSNDRRSYWTDLRHARPSGGNLLLVNRQIYSESIGLFLDASRDYWSSNHFYLNTPTVSTADKERLKMMDLSSIHHLKLVFQITWPSLLSHCLVVELNLIDSRGVWSAKIYGDRTGPDGSTQYYRLYTRHRDEAEVFGRTFGTRNEAMEACEKQGQYASVYDQIIRVVDLNAELCKRHEADTVPWVPRVGEELRV